MLNIARWHVLFGLAFAIAGMLLGIVMASSHDHTQHVTHAHILLLGFVVSLLYGVVLRLWLAQASARWARVQLVLHQAGTVVIVSGLYLLYAQRLPEPALGPVLGIGSVAVLAAPLLMQAMEWRNRTAAEPAVAAATAVPVQTRA